MKDHTEGKIKEHPKLIGHFDGGCEPRNPGGVCTSAWIIHDADTNETLAGQGMVVRDGRGKKDPSATNNYAEYCALGLMLRFLVDSEWRGEIKIYSDSKLVVNQVTDQWQMKSKTLRPLREKVWEHMQTLELEVGDGTDFECFACDHKGTLDSLIDLDGERMLCPQCSNEVTGFRPPSNCTLEWVPREQNEQADGIGRDAYHQYLKAKR